MIKPGVKFFDLLSSKNMREMTLATEWNRQSKGSVLLGKNPEIFINGKDAMAMLNVDEFESHRSGAFHAVFVFPQEGQNRL